MKMDSWYVTPKYTVAESVESVGHRKVLNITRI